MEFDIITECISCDERKLCNEVVVEYKGKQRVINFCEDCNNELEDISIWANYFSLKYKKLNQREEMK